MALLSCCCWHLCNLLFQKKVLVFKSWNQVTCIPNQCSLCFLLQATLPAVWAMPSEAQRRLDFPVRKSSRQNKASQNRHVIANDSRGSCSLEQSLRSKLRCCVYFLLPLGVATIISLIILLLSCFICAFSLHLLRATVVIWGRNGYWIGVSTQSWLEKIILLLLLPGFELATFRSWGRRSTNKLFWLPWTNDQLDKGIYKIHVCIITWTTLSCFARW